jgi:hypothetical protein
MLTDELVQIARKYEIKLIFSTLIRNIRDYPPRKYDGTIDLAFPPMSPQEYKSHKEDQKKDQSNMWRLARWYDNNGNKEKANTLYTKVSDLAYGIGRIHSQLQEYIRGIHKIYPDVDCVDVEKDIQKIFDTKSLGNDAIIDWVHPKVETNYYIARSMLFAINPTLERRFGKRKYSIPDFQTVLYEAHPHAEVLKANGLVEGGFTNLGGLGPDIAKKLFLEGLKNRPSSEYQAKAFIGLALIALREKDRKTLSDMISRLKKLNTNIIRANLYHYRGFKEIMKIHSLLKIDEE